jgi:uncharacterized membrane protein YczE
MEHLLASLALIFGVCSLTAALSGNPPLGLPGLLLCLCFLGGLYLSFEGVGIGMIVFAFAIGAFVSWWLTPFLVVLGLAVFKLEPQPTTPRGWLVESFSFEGGSSGDSGAGGGDGGGE